MLLCNKFECEDYRQFSVLCQSCEARDGHKPTCSITSLCSNCTKEFSPICPQVQKDKGDKYE
jgi:hypothetical protein